MANNNEKDKEPWNQVLVNLWHLSTTGLIKFLTIPIFIILTLLTLVGGPIDGYITVRNFYNENFNKKTSLTTGECDCINEWVILINYYDSKGEANEELAIFKEEMISTGLVTKLNDIYVVRSPNSKNQWSIAFDANSGVATKEKVENVIKAFWARAKRRNYTNIIERWLRNARAYYYSVQDFEKFHGKIVNSESCLTKTMRIN
jgi:hypothetical protein